MAIHGTVPLTAQSWEMDMKLKTALFASLAAMATPAFAGSVVPSPEIGAGLAAMTVIGVGYAYLRRRSAR